MCNYVEIKHWHLTLNWDLKSSFYWLPFYRSVGLIGWWLPFDACKSSSPLINARTYCHIYSFVWLSCAFYHNYASPYMRWSCNEVCVIFMGGWSIIHHQRRRIQYHVFRWSSLRKPVDHVTLMHAPIQFFISLSTLNGGRNLVTM